ncbi:MAG: hypothetical protein GEU79_08405 [Acidimicrobiia bacterium]|nr:hypothetical protein [Acidimicrobiia bacterium]
MDRARLLTVLAVIVTLMMATGVSAQPADTTVGTGTVPVPDELTVTTPFPGVAVEPGDQVSFALTIASPERADVALAVDGIPEGWRASFSGGGFEIDRVTAGPGLQPEASLDVNVPAEAGEGSHDLTVTATADGETVEVPLSVRVSEQAGGDVTLTPDFPGLRTSAGEAATFNLELNNATPSDMQFELSSSGPAGWDVIAQPSGEAQASTILVAAGSTETVTVEATSPAQVESDQYPISVQATAGDTEVSAEMIVEIVGSFSLELSTPDQRLNTEVTVGISSTIDLLVTNTGTAPLQGVEMSATPPGDWEVTFEQPTIPNIPPGEAVVATATINPSDQAIAGDYVIDFSATHEEVDEGQLQIRTTVNPSTVWGFVGIGLIALTLAALALVFRRFGRR